MNGLEPMVDNVTEECNDDFSTRYCTPKKVMIILLLVTGRWKKVTIISLLITGPSKK
jgi:hypothetical protein